MPAPKGNKYAEGCETSGKPLAFETPEELQSVVDAYFYKGTKENDYEDRGEAWVQNGEYVSFMPTMSGLAVALGVDRRTITNYSNREEYFPIIKKARALVEKALEQRLYFPQPTGVIFNLKNNFDWNDKQELDHTSSDNSMSPKSVSADVVDALVSKLIE